MQISWEAVGSDVELGLADGSLPGVGKLIRRLSLAEAQEMRTQLDTAIKRAEWVTKAATEYEKKEPKP